MARAKTTTQPTLDEWAAALVADWPLPGPRVADRLASLLLKGDEAGTSYVEVAS